ncbi:MAG: hypothetical protein EON91_04505, partial [Brevundimonas sp.]
MSFAGLLSIVAPAAPTGDSAPASAPGSDVAAEFEALVAIWSKSALPPATPDKDDKTDEAETTDAVIQPATSAPPAVTPSLIVAPVVTDGGQGVNAEGEAPGTTPPVAAPVTPSADIDTAPPAPHADAPSDETVSPVAPSAAPTTGDASQPARPVGAETAPQPARTASPAQAPAQTANAAATSDVPAPAPASTATATPAPRAETAPAPT